MENEKLIKKFRKEYKEAYKGVLSDEVLANGNKWFENFISENFRPSLSLERIEEAINNLQNPYPSHIFTSEVHQFYKKIYDNARRDCIEAIKAELDK